MIRSVQTNRFCYTYMEDTIETALLRENHCHAQFEMIIVLDGNVKVLLDSITYRLTANQAIIIPPLVYHTLTIQQPGIYRRVVVQFDLSSIPTALHRFFPENSIRLSVFSCPFFNELGNICKSNNPNFYESLADSFMIQAMYESLVEEETNSSMQVDDLLQSVIHYINAHLCERLTLDDIALHAAVSKSTLCHHFLEKMKISPKQFILQKRLALANKLICNGTVPTVAAVQVGYHNYSNFYRMYQKYYQTTPSYTYKKQPRKTLVMNRAAIQYKYCEEQRPE